jgi:hypothetical protein
VALDILCRIATTRRGERTNCGSRSGRRPRSYVSFSQHWQSFSGSMEDMSMDNGSSHGWHLTPEAEGANQSKIRSTDAPIHFQRFLNLLRSINLQRATNSLVYLQLFQLQSDTVRHELMVVWQSAASRAVAVGYPKSATYYRYVLCKQISIGLHGRKDSDRHCTRATLSYHDCYEALSLNRSALRLWSRSASLSASKQESCVPSNIPGSSRRSSPARC